MSAKTAHDVDLQIADIEIRKVTLIKIYLHKTITKIDGIRR